VVIIDKKNKVLDLLIYIVLILILFQGSFSYYINSFNNIDNVFIILVIIIGIISIFRSARINKVTIYLFLSLCVFFIIGLISYYINSYDSDSIYAYLGSLSYLRFFFLIMAFANIPSEFYCYRVIKCLKRIGLISSVFLPIQFLMGSKYTNIFTFVIPGDQTFLGITGCSGLFYHSAVAAWFYCFIFSIFLIERLILKNKKNTKILTYLFFIVVLTLKVKSIIALLIIFTVLTLTLKNKNSKFSKGIIAIGTGFLVAIISFLFKNLFIRQIQLYILGDGSGINETARFSLLHNAFRIIAMYFPFGVGFSKYGSWYASINYSEYYYLFGMNNIYGLAPTKSNFSTDTFWPAVMGETGVLGTIMYLVILMYMCKILIKKYGRTLSTRAQLILMLGIVTILQMFVESLAAPTFNTSPYIIVGSFFIGVGISISKIDRKEHYYDEQDSLLNT